MIQGIVLRFVTVSPGENSVYTKPLHLYSGGDWQTQLPLLKTKCAALFAEIISLLRFLIAVSSVFLLG